MFEALRSCGMPASCLCSGMGGVLRGMPDVQGPLHKSTHPLWGPSQSACRLAGSHQQAAPDTCISCAVLCIDPVCQRPACAQGRRRVSAAVDITRPVERLCMHCSAPRCGSAPSLASAGAEGGRCARWQPRSGCSSRWLPMPMPCTGSRRCDWGSCERPRRSSSNLSHLLLYREEASSSSLVMSGKVHALSNDC